MTAMPHAGISLGMCNGPCIYSYILPDQSGLVGALASRLRWQIHASHSALYCRGKRTTCLYDVPINILCNGSAYIKTAMVPPTTPTTTPAIPSHPAFMPIPGVTTLPAAPVL